MKMSKAQKHAKKRLAEKKKLASMTSDKQNARKESIAKRVKKTEARQKAASAAARKRRQNENNR